MSKITTGVKSYSNNKELTVRKEMYEHFKECPIPEDQILSNMGLFTNSKDLSRILFMDYLYRLSKETQGVILTWVQDGDKTQQYFQHVEDCMNHLIDIGRL